WSAGGNPGINYKVLGISLAPANQQYRRNSSGLVAAGDLEFVWDSCSTYYQDVSGGGEVVKTGVAKADLSTTATSWRPGSNCGNLLTQDNTDTAQSFVYDTTAPTMTSVAGSGANTYQTGNTLYVNGTTSGTATLTPTGTDPGTAPNLAGVRDYTYGAMAGTTTGWSPTSTVTQAGARAYAWTSSVGDAQSSTVALNVNDKANNQSATGITITLIGDDTAPGTTFTTPAAGTTYQTSTSMSVAWTETETGSGIASRSLQRQAVLASGGACGTFANDGTAVTTASPSSQTLAEGYCYRWIQTLTDHVGLSSSVTSGIVIVDATVPTATFLSPLPNQVEQGVVDVTGTASDLSSFRDWTLDYGVGASPTTWIAISSGTSQVAGGFIGDWDTRTLSGLNTVRLTVRDWAGHSSQTTSTVFLENTERGAEPYRSDVPFDLGGGWSIAIATDTGEARLSRDLFSIPSYGPPQALSLNYSSLVPDASGRFGVGWSSNLTQYLSFESGDIVWHRADGARIPFGQMAGVWTPLSGHFETMTVSTSPAEDTVILADQTKLVFENAGNGRLKRIENRFGKALTLVWNTSSATATDASGRVMNITINSSKDRITAVTDSAGRAWSFGYATGNTNDLISITDPAGKVTTLVYDGSHHLTSVTRTRTPATGSAETVTWSIGYTSGKATSVTDPINTTVSNTLTYNSGNTVVGLLKTYSPLVRNSSTYTFGFSGPGSTTQITDPAGFTTTRGYDGQWRLTSVSRPVGVGPVYQLVSYTYDRGNVATETTQLDAIGTTTQTVSTYNATNDLLTRSEADADASLRLVTKSTYDGAGHLTSVDLNCTTSGTTSPSPASSCTGAGNQDASTNLITTYSYTANDQLFDATDPLGRVTRHTYDTDGNELSVIANYQASGSGADVNVTSATAFDQATTAGKAGLVTSTTDPLGNVTTYTYDSLGRPLSESLPGDATIPALTRSKTFDEFGNLLTETDVWTGVSRLTTHIYDKANRETSLVDPTGTTTTTTYDAAGDATGSSSAGVTTTRTFDGLGRALTETVGTSTTTHVYDPAGDETETVDPAGVTTDRTFDLASRLLTESVSGMTTTYLYDALGRTDRVIDPAGAQTDSAYDRLGRTLQTTVDGLTTWNAYDRAGNLLSTKSPTGEVSASLVDGLDRTVASITNCTNSGTTQPAGGVVCTGAGTSDRSTNVTTLTYFDAAGNTIATTDPNAISTRSVPNVRNLTATMIVDCTDVGHLPANPPTCGGGGTSDPATNVTTTYVYDGGGATLSSVTTVSSGPNVTTVSAYDGVGRVVASLDPMGTITRTFYDSNGRVSSSVVNCTTSGTTIPTDWVNCTGAGTQDGTFNLTTSFTYDSHGNKATETGPNGRVTQFTYDAADRLVAQTENYTTGSPAADQNLTTYFAYDDAGRQIAFRSPTADRATFTVTASVYDAAGHVTTEIRNCTVSGVTPPGDPGWQSCAGQGTKDASTNLTTTYTYDLRGNRLSITAPDPSATGSSQATVITDYAYDASDRLCRVLDGAASVTTLTSLTHPCTDAVSGTTTSNVSTLYTYDGAGNGASTTDGRGNVTAYGYDAAGRMVTLTDALGHTESWAYDALGRRTGQSNRDGTSVSWTYDGAGRTLTRSASGVATVSYTYDAGGNRLTAADGTSTITTTYDRLNRPLTVAVSNDSGAATSYSYGLTSAGWTDPTGSYLATLDAFGREVSLTDPIHVPTIWASTYRADGELARLGAPNGNTTTDNYDPSGRPTGSSTVAGPTARASYVYTLNRAGQRLSENSQITGDPTNGVVTFTYDPLARLTGYSGTPVTTQTYGWDKVPNRTTLQIGGGTTVTTTYDVANRPTTDTAGGSYTSDLDGRLTAMPGKTLTWDSLGRLLQMKDASSNVISTYSYDPLDRLLTVTRSSGATKFRYVGGTTTIAQARDGSGTVLWNVVSSLAGQARMDFGPGGTTQRFYGTNGHGDLTWTADSTGAVTATLRSDPWGVPGTSSGGLLPDFRFQGSWYDTNAGLSWVMTRWYAPTLGQFVSEDSILGQPTQPATRQLYAYGAGEPVARVDPGGRFWYRTKLGQTTVLSIANAVYGAPYTNWVRMANPGGRITPVNLRVATSVVPGSCIWIPYRNVDRSLWGCNPHPLAAYQPYNSFLYNRFFLTRDFIYNHVLLDRKDGSGGVGEWWDAPLLLQPIAIYPNLLVLAEFRNEVHAGGPWDYKGPLAVNYGLGNPYYTAVAADPAPEVLFYDVWTNIHYGYVGRAHGIPADILHAGAEQFGGIRTVSDWSSVEAGIRLWSNYGLNLPSSAISSEILRLMDSYRNDPTDPNEVLAGLHR
ncbi:MAG: RHS repeat-associated core domain-containing protein, partial [Acidimicrobiales bacterium]